MKTPTSTPGLPSGFFQAFVADEPTLREQRAHPRCRFHTEVTLESHRRRYTGLTHDISRGGLFLATERLFPLGQLVNLSFALPGYPCPFEARASVRWIRDASFTGDPEHPPGMGLEFLELRQRAS